MASEAETAQGDGHFDLLLKNPGASLQNETFQMQCPCNYTVGQLKQLLQHSYPGSPAPEAITLIYAGKVLKDNALVLSSFLPQRAGPVAVHIVVKVPAATAAASPSPSYSSQQRPAQAARPVASPRRENGMSAAQYARPAAAAAPTPSPSRSGGAGSGTDRPAPASVPAAAQPMLTFGAGMPLPSAAAATMPPMFGAASNMYGPAYQAAYAAALHALMAQPSAAAAGGEGAPPSAAAVLPAMLPVPQPVLPAALWQSDARPASPEGQAQQAQAAANAPMQAYFVPVMPMQYAVQMPLPAQQAQQHAEARQLLADLRQRRRRLEAYLQAERQMMQDAGMEIPPHLMHPEDFEQAGAAAAGRGRARRRGRPGGRAFQLRIRINVRALLQLGVLLLVVYQHCPPRRFLMLCALGAVLWISTHPRVRAFLQHLVQAPNPAPADARAGQQDGAAQQEGGGVGVAAFAVPPQEGLPEGGVPGAAPGVAGAPGAAAAAPPPPAAQGGVLNQIQAFVAGFITSLLPAMDNLGGDPDAGPMRDVFGGGGGD